MRTVEERKLTAKQKANLRRWVEALESGEYRQTRQKLKGKFGYCCLGVACEAVFIPTLWATEWGPWGGLSYRDDDGHEFDLDAELNEDFRESLGISEDEERRYIRLNDKSHANFKRIAAEIRKNHPEAFA